MKTTKRQLRIPRILTKYCEGNLELAVEGDSIGAILDELNSAHPKLYECVCDETGKIRRHINLFLNNELLVFPEAFKTEVGSDDVVSVFQAVSGG